MKRCALLGSAVWLLLGATATGAEQECEPAVDRVDRHDAVNQMADCDYSDRGLNGWLSGLRDESPAASETSKATEKEDAASAADKRFALTSDPLAGALELAQARYALVVRAAERCQRESAVVIQQRYRSAGEGQVQLTLVFSCRA